MRKYLVIFLLIILAAALSLVLVPNAREIALMQFRDKEYDKALANYEQRMKDGTLNVEVVSALTKLHLQEGDVDKAIEVMEKFVVQNPKNIEARERLGQLYQYAQRPDDYLANLEEINKLRKSDDALRTMNEMYNAAQQYEKQEPALEALVGKDGEREPSQYRNLARLKSTQQKLDEAVAVYQEFWNVHPDVFTFEDMEVMMTYQLELDDPEGAYQTAVRFTRGKEIDPKKVARIINVLHYRGNVELAERFEEPYDANLKTYPDIAIEKVYLLLAKDDRAQAYEILKWLDAAVDLPVSLQREYIGLLASNGEYEQAQERLEKLDFTAIQESEGVALVELALQMPQSKLMPILDRRMQAESLRDFGILQAAMAAATDKPNWQELMDAIDKQQLNDSQKLQMASVCLYSKHASCVMDFMALVNEGTLSKADILRAADIYMQVGDREKATALIDPLYKQTPDDAIVSAMYVQLAAADGRAEEVSQWIANNPNASESSLRDIYFTAQKYHHQEIALDTVDYLAKAYQNEQNLGFLIDAYVAAGRYEAVLPYFRQKSSLSAKDREDYLYVLTKLARKSNKYSAELVEFARSEMHRSDVTAKQKRALVYSLMDVGRPDIVLPFIEEFARTSGGEWVDVYASELDKLGRHDEARDFRLRLAMGQGVSDVTRRQIAYQLLEHGYKSDAEAVFALLSDGAGPESTDVQQLLYLWGTRPSIDKIDWLAGRYVSEVNPAAKTKWAEYVSNYASRDDLLTVVSRFPSLVNETSVQNRYFESLNQIGQLSAYGDELLARDDVSDSALRLYARAARSYNLNDNAMAAYYRLNEVTGGDPEALRVIGLLAFTQADYSETLKHLQPYADYREQHPGYDPEDYQAYYYLAETLKRDRDDDAAHYYYGKALEAAAVVPNTDVDLLTKTAQSLIGYGDEQKGRDYFETGMQQFPDSRLLVADYTSSMIELQDYDKARALLATAPASAPLGVSSQTLDLPPTTVSRYQVQVDGNEAILRFDSEVPKNFPLLTATKAQYPWLNYVGNSYNEVLVVAEPSYVLQIQPTMDGAGYVLTAMPAPDSAEEQFAQELDLRYQMLDARIGLETGDHYAVTDKLVELTELYPNNGTLLGYTANALNFTGRWKYAQKMLERAHEVMPMNEDILQLQRDINIRHDAENHVKVNYDWVSIGDSNENLWSLSGLVYVDEDVEIGANLETADVQAKGVRRIDGREGNFHEDAQRGEIYVAHEGLDGQRIQGSVYGNNDTFGLGLSYQWLNSLGISRVYAEYQRPNWDFVEGILDDATRDRIGFEHSYIHNTLWSFEGGAALNRYNLRDADGVADTVSAVFSATRQLRQAHPYLAANYTLDAEYRIGKKLFTNLLNEQYYPLFDSREVHTVSLIAAEQFTPQTDGLIQAGYSYDRLGGNGPLIAGQLTHEMLDDQLEAQIRGSYGARTSDSEGDTTRVGGHLKWRF